VKL
jgi:hypothetical protein